MIARAAEWNPMIFSSNMLQPDPIGISREYTKIVSIDFIYWNNKKLSFQAIDFDQHVINVKYVVQQFLHEDLESELAKKVLSSGKMNEIWFVNF